MAHTLYSFHPLRGVTHQPLDPGLNEFMAELMQHDRKYDPYLPEYYVFTTEDMTTQWWYYCQNKAKTNNPNEVPSPHMNPWQKRSADGVPKEIRAYHLLLG